MTILKWIGRGTAVLLGIAVAGIGVVYASTEMRMRGKVTPPARSTVEIRADSATVSRGRHLATVTSGCADCHGADFGGKMVVDDPGVMVLHATNLTSGPGGVMSRYSDAQLVAAIREGVGDDGRKLIFMPSHEFADMADDEVAALVAYLRTLPAIARTTPPIRVGPVARALDVAGQVVLLPYDHIDHARATRAQAPSGNGVERGKYLANGCVGCHGAGFSGGTIPGSPPSWKPAANISPTGIGTWTRDDFARAMRSGQRPDGSMIDSLMPWRNLRGMGDDELDALYAYLKTVPPRPTGMR
jgi:mono/diheme cytochrome c family protein